MCDLPRSLCSAISAHGGGGIESLPCKETFVVVACSRVVQVGADFSSRWKRVTVYRLFTFSLHAGPRQRCSVGALNFPFPPGEFHRKRPAHSRCLDCSHLGWLLLSKLARVRHCNRMSELCLQMCYTLKLKVIKNSHKNSENNVNDSGFSRVFTVLLVSCQTHEYLPVVSQKVCLFLRCSVD